MNENPLISGAIDLTDCKVYSNGRNKIPMLELGDGRIVYVGGTQDAVRRIYNLHAASVFFKSFNLPTLPRQLTIGSCQVEGEVQKVPILIMEVVALGDKTSFSLLFPDNGATIETLLQSADKIQLRELETVLWVDYLLWNTERTKDTLYINRVGHVLSEMDGALFENSSNLGMLPKLDKVFEITKHNPLNLISKPDWDSITDPYCLRYIDQVKRRYAMIEKVWDSK